MSGYDAVARYYDADHGDFVDDVAVYRELARRAGGRVLEVMCGSGRVLEPLARSGLRVTGVDSSPEMLRLARERLERAGLLGRAALHEGDARHSLPAGPFGFAFVALNSFMHLTTVADQLAALRQLHAALAPGGLLALDLLSPDSRDMAGMDGGVVLDRTFTLPDGAQVQKFVAQRSDMARQLNHVTFIYDELDAAGAVRRTTYPFTMRWTYRYELEHLLARCGFALDAVYGSYELDEYGPGSELMLTVARRV